MGDSVKIVECPRDAWQGLPGLIPAERKAAYLRALIAAGFTSSMRSASCRPQLCRRWRTLKRCCSFSALFLEWS